MASTVLDRLKLKIYNILPNGSKSIKDNKINRCRSLIDFKKKSSMPFEMEWNASLRAWNGMEKGI